MVCHPLVLVGADSRGLGCLYPDPADHCAVLPWDHIAECLKRGDLDVADIVWNRPDRACVSLRVAPDSGHCSWTAGFLFRAEIRKKKIWQKINFDFPIEKVGNFGYTMVIT